MSNEAEVYLQVADHNRHEKHGSLLINKLASPCGIWLKSGRLAYNNYDKWAHTCSEIFMVAAEVLNEDRMRKPL